MAKRGKRRERTARPAPASASVAAAPEYWRFALGALALIAAALALYWSGLFYPLVFDDAALGGQHPLAPSPLARRWLPDASFAWVQLALGGALLPQRLVNVLLHGATAAVLFGFLARLFGALLEERRVKTLAFF